MHIVTLHKAGELEHFLALFTIIQKSSKKKSEKACMITSGHDVGEGGEADIQTC